MEKINILIQRFNYFRASGDECLKKRNLEGAKKNYQTANKAMIEAIEIADSNKKAALLSQAKSVNKLIEEINKGFNEKQQNLNGVENGSSSSKKEENISTEGDEEFSIMTNTGITFDDVVGADDIKKFIKSSWINRFDPRYQAVYSKKTDPSKISKGLLLYGLPGTGKTMLAKAIASEVKATFFLVDGKMTDKYVGETEKAISRLFARASKEKLSIIFIDEIDDVLSLPSDSNASHKQSAFNQWLREMEGFDAGKSTNVIVIGSTNYPHKIAPAAISRLTQRFRVDVPDFKLRLQMIENNLNNDYIDDENLYNILASDTQGYSARGIRDISNKIKEETEYMQTKAIDDGVDASEAILLRLGSEDVKKIAANISSAISSESLKEISRFELDYNIKNSEGSIYEYMDKIKNEVVD